MFQLIRYVQQFGRFQRNARLYLISNALSGVTTGIILVLYNLYLVSLGYKTDFIGLLLLVVALGGGLAIFPAGLCIDRFGGKAILIWSSVLVGLVGAGQMLFRSPIPLLVSGFVAGVGGAFMLVVNIPFLSLHSSPEERPHLFSLNIVVALATSVVGEALGGVLPVWIRAIPWLNAPLSPAWSWLLTSDLTARAYQLSLLFAGIIAAPNFIPLFLMHDDGPGNLPATASQVQTAPMLTTLRAFWQASTTWLKGTPFSVMLAQPLVVMLIVQTLVWFGAGLFTPYLNLYFVQHLHASPALFGVVDASANLLNAFLTLLAPWFVQRVGRLAAITFTRLASLPLMLLIGLGGGLSLATVLYPLRQGLMDMTQGVMQVFSMDVIPKQHRGLANSSYQAAYQASFALASPLGGFIIARSGGYAPVFIIAAVFYLLAIALLWVRFHKIDLDRPLARKHQSTL